MKVVSDRARNRTLICLFLKWEDRSIQHNTTDLNDDVMLQSCVWPGQRAAWGRGEVSLGLTFHPYMLYLKNPRSLSSGHPVPISIEHPQVTITLKSSGNSSSQHCSSGPVYCSSLKFKVRHSWLPILILLVVSALIENLTYNICQVLHIRSLLFPEPPSSLRNSEPSNENTDDNNDNTIYKTFNFYLIVLRALYLF